VSGPRRADARRNRERLLVAARDTFVEHGVQAPLDDVARRAGVGIGTLYRHFPDRYALVRAVALDVLGRVTEAARTALAEEPDAFRALARYLHAALDHRIAAVMPVLSGTTELDRDDELRRARDELGPLFEAMVAAAQRDGVLRTDVGAGDLGLMVIRLARPLPLAVDRDADHAIAHRQLDLLLDGLRAPGTGTGSPLTLDDVRRESH
jgi:AcrR family transcriptional regulator